VFLKELIPMDEMGLFASKKDIVLVDSRWVAKAFGKEHKNVIRVIERILASEGITEEFGRLNFELSSYKNQQKKSQKCYLLTRKGFSILAMGFTGPQAMAFKVKYINRFEEMEEQLRNLVLARAQFPMLTAQIKAVYVNPKAYHYSNEADMLNRIVLGMTAKQYREKYDIPKGESIRPYLRADQIAMLGYLQNIDLGLVLGVPDFQQRKNLLQAAAVNALGKYGTTRESIAMQGDDEEAAICME